LNTAYITAKSQNGISGFKDQLWRYPRSGLSAHTPAGIRLVGRYPLLSL